MSSDPKSFPKTAIPAPVLVKSREISIGLNFVFAAVAVIVVLVTIPSFATSPIEASTTLKVTAVFSSSLICKVAALLIKLESAAVPIVLFVGADIVATIDSIFSSSSSFTPVIVIAVLGCPFAIVTVLSAAGVPILVV